MFIPALMSIAPGWTTEWICIFISFLLNSGRRKRGKQRKKKVLNSFWSPAFNCFCFWGLPEVVLIFTLHDILVCLKVDLVQELAGSTLSVFGEHVHDASCLVSCWRGCRFVLDLLAAHSVWVVAAVQSFAHCCWHGMFLCQGAVWILPRRRARGFCPGSRKAVRRSWAGLVDG